jgi:maltose/moltooligosaccharide transporter
MQKNNTTDNGFVTIMNDFQFMPNHHETIGMGSILFFLVCAFSTVPGRYTTHLRHTTELHLKRITRCQVGEMFANYNLIAALAAFLLPPLLAKYTSRKFTHFIALYAVDLVLYPSISYRNQQPSLWNGFQ